MKVHVVSVVGGGSETLGQMIEHYRGIGIESIHIHIHATSMEDPSLERLKQVVKEHEATLASVAICPWSQMVNPMLYKVSRSKAPNDWYILADHDEFQVYPDDLKSVIRFCDSNGYDFVEGCFIDRIAEDGGLPQVSDQIPVWSQFPFGACISGPLMGAIINKVVLCKGYVELSAGQHFARSVNRCPARDVYIPVHHFKWTSTVLKRLENRIIQRKELREDVWKQSERFLRHFAEQNRINIHDPSYMVARCTPEYEHWERLREWKIATSYFHL